MAKTAEHLQKYNKQNKKVDDEKVIDLYNSGLSCNEIAKIFKCSKHPILKALKNTIKRNVGSYSHCRNKNQNGELNPAWKGGKKSIYDQFRGLTEYWNWRAKVLKKDNCKCTQCNSEEKLQAHHLNFLRFLIDQYCIEYNKTVKQLTVEDLKNSFFYNLNNGLTLCESCHKEWHKINGR